MTDKLEFKDCTGKISVESSPDDTAVNIEAEGAMVIGGAYGFKASITAEIDTINKEMTTQVNHAGGWKPFGSLLDFTSPVFDGELGLKSDGTFSVGASATLSSSIPLFDSSLQLRGQGDDTGPAFNVALSGDHTDTPTLSASFTALVSINVGSQIDLGVEVGLDSSTSSFTLAGDYTAGNTKPSRWSKLQSGLWQCWHEMYRYVNVKTNCTDN